MTISKDDLEGAAAKETDLALSFEKCYLESCELNSKDPSDLEYFRSYVWQLLSIHSMALDNNNDSINNIITTIHR